MQKMLQLNHKRRLTLAQDLEHPWITSGTAASAAGLVVLNAMESTNLFDTAE
jgi:hypothetical protein